MAGYVVVLDANPLVDVANVRKIAMVIKDGRVVDRASLPVRKVLTTPRGPAPAKPASPTSSQPGAAR